MLIPHYAIPRTERRLFLGFSASVAIHAAIIFSVSPATYRHVTASPLTVEILRETTANAPGEITTARSPSEFPASPVIEPPLIQAIPREAPQSATSVRETSVDINVPLDKYFTTLEVDIGAEQLNEVELVYPQRAFVMRTKGKVVLRIFISDQGAIDEVSVLEAAPAGVFEQAALTATLALRFRPAVKYGRHVKSQKTIEVIFDPYESINVP
jgi:TonB family protein